MLVLVAMVAVKDGNMSGATIAAEPPGTPWCRDTEMAGQGVSKKEKVFTEQDDDTARLFLVSYTTDIKSRHDVD